MRCRPLGLSPSGGLGFSGDGACPEPSELASGALSLLAAGAFGGRRFRLGGLCGRGRPRRRLWLRAKPGKPLQRLRHGLTVARLVNVGLEVGVELALAGILQFARQSIDVFCLVRLLPLDADPGPTSKFGM
jgi:hypothetical protein